MDFVLKIRIRVIDSLLLWIYENKEYKNDEYQIMSVFYCRHCRL